MSALLVLITLAAAAELPGSLRPVVADPGVPGRFAAWRAEKGLPPAELACEPALPGAVLLCFRLWEGTARRWITRDDLAGWGATTADLRAALLPEASRRLAAAEVVQIPGTTSTYVRLTDGDGWAASAILAPAALAARLGAEGAPIRVSLPTEGVLLAWVAGDADRDRILAVAAREIYDAQPGSVSPAVFTWDGRVWTSFGEALPTGR
jgi:hypothetical protein